MLGIPYMPYMPYMPPIPYILPIPIFPIPYIPYEGNNFLRTALLKFKDYKVIKPALKKIVSLYAGKSVHLTINIDPYNF